MNSEQVMSMVRLTLSVLGTIAGTLGWAAPETISTITAQVLAAVGPLMLLGGTIWSMIAHTKTSLIEKTSSLPEVNSNKLAAAIEDPALKAAAKVPPPTK